MRLGRPSEFTDLAGTRGTMGGYDPFVEGDDESRRAAHEAQMQDRRVLAARANKAGWYELDYAQLEPVGRYLADSEGTMWERVREQVWGSGDPRSSLNEHIPNAFTLVGDPPDVLFLKRYGRRVDYEGARASQARTAEMKRELEVNRLRSLPLRPVTLSDLEGRQLPTVRQAAEMVYVKHGRVEEVDGHLVVFLPEGHAREEELQAARVLYAAAPIVLEALASKDETPIAKRLPDAHVLAGGGLA